MRRERRRRIHALDRVRRLARSQRRRGRPDQRLLRHDIAGRRRHRDLVAAGGKPREAHVAARVRRARLAGDRRAGPIQQVDRHARQVRVPAVLRAVAVRVRVNMRRERRRRIHALDRVRAGVGRIQSVHNADIRLLRHTVACRRHDRDLVVPIRQTGKTHITAAVRLRRLDEVAQAIQQIDRHVGQVRLRPNLLRAVAVGVRINVRRERIGRDGHGVIVGHRRNGQCRGGYDIRQIATFGIDRRIGVRFHTESHGPTAGSLIRGKI